MKLTPGILDPEDESCKTRRDKQESDLSRWSSREGGKFPTIARKLFAMISIRSEGCEENQTN